MISRILNRNSALGNTFRLFALQLLLVAVIATAVLTVQVGTASADTGTDIGTETISAPAGKPPECWLIPVPCIIFGAQ